MSTTIPDELLESLLKKLQAREAVSSDDPVLQAILTQVGKRSTKAVDGDNSHAVNKLELGTRFDREYNRFDREYNRFDREYNRFDREYNRFDRTNALQVDELNEMQSWAEQANVGAPFLPEPVVDEQLAVKVELARQRIFEELRHKQGASHAAFFQSEKVHSNEGNSKATEKAVIPAFQRK